MPNRDTYHPQPLPHGGWVNPTDGTMLMCATPAVNLPTGPEHRVIMVKSLGAPVAVRHSLGETVVPAHGHAGFDPTPVAVPDDGTPPVFSYVPRATT